MKRWVGGLAIGLAVGSFESWYRWRGISDAFWTILAAIIAVFVAGYIMDVWPEKVAKAKSQERSEP
jgi:phosphate/sulfate permease